MATQKQRRRRAKEKRHDYDLVYVDEDGVEQVIERDEPRKPPAKVGKGSSSRGSEKGTSKSTGSRRGREVQPPSWRKVIKRGAIFAPIFLATVLLLGGGKVTFLAAAIQTAALLAVFVPFSYLMDRIVWRQQLKRLSRGS